MPPEENNSPEFKIDTNPTPLKQIRTFQGDVASALERQKESLFSIQQIEQLKRASGGTIPDTSRDDSGKRREFFYLILGSILLIALGLIGAWYGYQEFLKKTAPPTIVAPESRFIPAQESVEIDMTGASRDALLTKISEESLGLAKDELKHMILRKGAGIEAPLATAAEFFQALQAKASGSLIRSFDPLFMLGSLGQSRFLILKLFSFENAFAGMLAWEKTLGEDLGPMFATAPLLKSIGSETVFKDVISKNKDVRVLSSVGTTTEPIILYSFFDNRMLIITDDLETLRILIDRLTQELLSR